jgi:predicted deacetylase
MIPTPAQYLLRLDDLCPTMPQARWDQYRRILAEFRIHPILAVVPDNRDPELMRSPHDPRFWEQMRELENAGATIALHGHQHRCESYGASLLGLHAMSEFAGIDLETQRQWIRAGIGILRENALEPRLWVGPRHGFDRNTLQALREEGLNYISDGFARVPYRRYGATWIPQQLWAPVAKPKGLWTICIHPQFARESDLERLRLFLKGCWPQFTSFERVLREFEGTALPFSERIYEGVALWRAQRRARRRRRRG